MNKITKPILVSALSALAFGTVGVAGTFALFTDGTETQITASAGIVKASIAFNGVATYSAKADSNGTIVDERGGKYVSVATDVAGTFTNGGTASIDDQTHYLTLDQITPGDKVAFTVNPSSTGSTVDIQYRLTYAVVQDQTHNMDLAKGLVTTIGSTSYVGLENYQSGWTLVELGGNSPLFGVAFTIELPITAGNQYQGKSATIALGIEAVQGNAAVFDSEYAKCYDDGEAEAVVPATGNTVVEATNEAQTATVKTTIPAAATQISAGDTVKLLVSDVETKQNASDPTYMDLEFDASLYVNNVKVTQFSQAINVEVQLATGLVISGVKHNGESVTNYAYNSETGKLTFSTSSFSPFVVTYKTYVPYQDYGFYDSYVENGHWVHEIKTADHYRNVFDHIAAKKDTSAADTHNGGTTSYPLADSTTVYKIKNDIDFGGAIWTEGYLNENGLPVFTGTLTADQQVKLSNVHVYFTMTKALLGHASSTVEDLHNLDSDAKLIGLMGAAKNATIENITLDDFILSHKDGKGGGLFAYGTRVENTPYRYNAGSFTMRNCVTNANCLVKGISSLGGFVCSGRCYSSMTFDNCANNANVLGSKHTNAGFVATASINHGNLNTSGGTSNLKFKNCENKAQITGTYRIAGFCGHVDNDHDIIFEGNNVNSGSIFETETSTSNHYFGAFLGFVDNSTVTFVDNCKVKNNVSGQQTNLFVPNTGIALDVTEYGLLGSHMVDGNGNDVTAQTYAAFYAINPQKSVVVGFDGEDHYRLTLSNTPNAEDIDKIVFAVDVYSVLSYYNGTDYPVKTWGAVAQDHKIYTTDQYETVSDLTSNIYQIKHVGYFLPQDAEVYNDTLGLETSQVHLLDNDLKTDPNFSNGWHFANNDHSYIVVTNEDANGTFYHAIVHWRLRIEYTVTFYDAAGNIIGNGTYYDGHPGGDDPNPSTITAIPVN